MKRKRAIKLIGIITIITLLGIAVACVLFALKQNINLFFTPTQLLQTTVRPEQILRVGGYVKPHSVHYAASGQEVSFTITDRQHDLVIHYIGVLPNLFRENQGVVVTGSLNAGHGFAATEVLAKHDEKYMPWGMTYPLKPKKGAA